jgi:hypothetical protein
MKKQMSILFFLALLSLTQSWGQPEVVAQTKNVFKDTIQSTALTIYKDATLAQQMRTLTVDAGRNTYFLGHIPSTIYPESLMITLVPGNKDIQVLECSVGEETNNPDLQMKMLLDSKTSSTCNAELLYLFKNLEWRIDYVLHFSPNYEEVYLNGWIEIANKSGVPFSKAQVQFVDSRIPAYYSSLNVSSVTSDEKDKLSAPDALLSSNYPHAYIYALPIDIPALGSKRISWVYSQHVEAKQDFRVFVGDHYLEDMEGKPAHPTVETWISFANTNDHGLGQPLPSGVASLYHADEKGRLEVLGKASIPHTPIGQDVSVKIPPTQAENCSFTTGQARALKAFETELDQAEFKKLSDKITEASYRLNLKNKSDRPITIRVTLDLPNGEWTIVKENLSHQQNGDQQAFWTIQVDANSEVDLKYRVRLIRV